MEILPRASLLSLRELAAFGTMRAAADVLGVTPGAVSQQIAGLEQRLGVTLVVRSGRQVQLTDAGHLLVEHAEQILAAQDEAVAALAQARGDVVGPVTIGLFGSSAAVLPAVIKSVATLHPQASVRTREIDVDEALMAVRRGVVDLAFGLDYDDAPAPRVEGVSFVPLLTEDFGLAVSTGSGRRPGEVELVDAQAWSWILPPAATHYGTAMRVACRRAGFEPSVVHEVTDTAASLALASAGQGVAPVTSLMRRLVPDLPLTVLPLRTPMSRSLCLAVPDRADLRPSVRAVADVITAVLTADPELTRLEVR